MKIKILIDIDVIAVAKHYTKDNDYPIAKNFLSRVESGEFDLYSSHTLIALLNQWKIGRIMNGILDFYSAYCYTIPAAEIERKLTERKIILENLLAELGKKGVKKEDGILTVIASLFGLVLVTLNRKHLRNKRDEINEIFKKNGLSKIEIMLPNEI